MIIAVSDLHLGDMASNRTGFITFIEEYLKPNRKQITDLILLGDILDLWRRNNSRVILENLDILSSICSLGFRVTYLVGNHDMVMLDFGNTQTGVNLPEGMTWDSNNLTISQSLRLSSGGTSYRFIHGHQISYWYALPFYESFCESMCQVPEEPSEITDVWKLMERNENSLSPLLLKRLHHLTDDTRSQLEVKLAGPLEGHNISIEESMSDDLNLLHEFIEFRCPKDNVVQQGILEAIRKEVTFLSGHNLLEAKIESWREFVDVVTNGTLEEIASRFLITWSEILQWVISNTSRNDELIRNLLIRNATRIAAMFSGELYHDEFLVRGHGHNPFVDTQNRVADTGCWLGKKATYISIDNGKITCSHWSN